MVDYSGMRGKVMGIGNIWKYIFVAYVCLLLYFVVIKFNGSIDRVELIKASRDLGAWNYNLFPFRTITAYFKNISDSYAYINILGNVVCFVPMVFLIPMNFKKYRNSLKTILIFIICIIGIEIFQFVTMLGFFDVDDILLNMLGCMVGYSGYVGFRKLFSKHIYLFQKM